MSRLNETQRIYIDGKKLDRLLRNAGWNNQDASYAMGRSNNYINKKIRNGYINSSDAILISKLFDIDRSLYEIKRVEKKEPEPVMTQPTEVKVEIDYDKLQKTIYEAVYGAMINADKAIRESR